jgi:hypothetical protein
MTFLSVKLSQLLDGDFQTYFQDLRKYGKLSLHLLTDAKDRRASIALAPPCLD